MYSKIFITLKFDEKLVCKLLVDKNYSLNVISILTDLYKYYCTIIYKYNDTYSI